MLLSGWELSCQVPGWGIDGKWNSERNLPEEVCTYFSSGDIFHDRWLVFDRVLDFGSSESSGCLFRSVHL